jgi:predicted transcriptional regulator
MGEITIRSTDKVTVRMPEGLKNKLSELAKKNQRSINKEIIVRLLDSTGIDGVSISVVGEDAGEYLTEEGKLVVAYRKLPDKKKRAILELISDR